MNTKSMKNSSIQLYCYLGLLLLSCLIMVNTDGLTGISDISNWLENKRNHAWFICISILFMLVCALTPLPAEVIAILNITVYGPVMGAFITWVSAMLGAYLGFYITRRFGSLEIECNVLNPKQKQALKKLIDKKGALGFFIARLIPSFPFFLLNFLGGLLPISTMRYLLLTGIGIMPNIILLSFLADTLPQIF